MKNAHRVAILDRSVLAHNVYQMLLKPLGYTLFEFHSIKSMKNVLTEKMGVKTLLINSNVFGKNFEQHLDWLKKESSIKNMEKIFLCQTDEKKMQGHLKSLTKSRVILKPFYPEQLEEILEKVC